MPLHHPSPSLLLPFLPLLLLLLLPPCVQAKLGTTPYPRFTRPSSASDSKCAPDYEPCGTAVLAPVRNLPCCTHSFYCYKRGKYFSQCRPQREIKERKPLCGLDFGVCSAGNAADSAIPCCTQDFECKPAPPLYWQCLPKHPHTHDPNIQHQNHPWSWFRIIPSWMHNNPFAPNLSAQASVKAIKYTFQASTWSRLSSVSQTSLQIQPVRASEKLPHISQSAPNQRVSSLTATLPLLPDQNRTHLLTLLHDALSHAHVSIQLKASTLVVASLNDHLDVADVALTLAAFPQVLRVHLNLETTHPQTSTLTHRATHAT